MNNRDKKDIIGMIERGFISICMFGMLILILIATFARVSGSASITWGEELARYLMIWLAMIAVSIGFKNDAHLGLSFFLDRLRGKLKAIILAIRAVIILAFLIIVIYQGIQVVLMQASNIQYSPSLRIPMYFMYVSIPVGFLLSTVRFLSRALREIKLCWSQDNG